MIGFLTGVAVNIIAGQVSDLTGADADGSVPLTTALDVLVHPGRIELTSLLAGCAALALISSCRALALARSARSWR
jgi:SulP family sulfate permease